jgi:hypothetical protein
MARPRRGDPSETPTGPANPQGAAGPDTATENAESSEGDPSDGSGND